MIRTYFFIVTVFCGLLLHIIFSRYLSIFHASPDILLLLVVANGFLLGPLTGETLGFVLGLLADALGVSLFGLQTLLFVLAGYAAGKLSHHVDSERQTPQVVIACLATLFYVFGLSFIQSIFEEGGGRVSFGYLLLELSLNALMVTPIFWAADRWISLWKINREH